MNIPGFTAAYSLRHSGKKHAMSGAAAQRSGSMIEPQLRAGGTGLVSNACVDRLQNCYIDCSLKGGIYEEGCFDSCDAAYRLCNAFPGLSIAGGAATHII